MSDDVIGYHIDLGIDEYSVIYQKFICNISKKFGKTVNIENVNETMG